MKSERRPEKRDERPTAQALPKAQKPMLLLGFYMVLPVVLVGAAGQTTYYFIQRGKSAQANQGKAISPVPIDGQRAFKYLSQICEIGPRLAGSEANARQRKMVAEHFTKMGAQVREQPFRARHPLTGEAVDMANLIGSWHPERKERVVIGAHYDTRPHPDQETDPERLKLPFLGANDCASGVAVLMEMAHHLKDLDAPVGVDLVLFDGEELVYGDNPRRGEYFLGSKYFAQVYADQVERRRTTARYVAGIVLDMVGGKDMKISQEPNSINLAPDLVREVWTVADRLGARSFRFREGREVLDDHLALNDGGIRAIDIIDFDYPYWHKADDLPENCSAASLAEVGRVVTAWIALPRRRRR
jgi:hypothetical protein